MQMLKDNIIPILIVLGLSLLIGFGSLPLANTEWAESMRAGFAAESGEGEGIGGGFSLVVSLAATAKFAVLSLIGAGFTMLGTRVVRLFNRSS